MVSVIAFTLGESQLRVTSIIIFNWQLIDLFFIIEPVPGFKPPILVLCVKCSTTVLPRTTLKWNETYLTTRWQQLGST
jgi:hypothetical protein